MLFKFSFIRLTSIPHTRKYGYSLVESNFLISSFDKNNPSLFNGNVLYISLMYFIYSLLSHCPATLKLDDISYGPIRNKSN